jgi:hypothetical protein
MPDRLRPGAPEAQKRIDAHEEVHARFQGMISEIGKQIAELEKQRNARILFLFGGMDVFTCIAASRMLRWLGKVDRLEVILESSGGDLDSAIKLSKMLRFHCSKLSIVVPFWAKSAASLVAISADRIYMTPYAELGPIDPQVADPETDEFVPAHSIGRALDFVEETEDLHVKLALTSKLSPLLIGGYKDVESATEQEVREVCDRLRLPDPDGAVRTLTSTYLSHGYPVTHETLKGLGFPISQLSIKESEPFMRLHDTYVPLIIMQSRSHPHDENGECVLPSLVQIRGHYVLWTDERLFVDATPSTSEPSKAVKVP